MQRLFQFTQHNAAESATIVIEEPIMLFIIYGATLEWGWKSRQFFQKHNFQVIIKNNYVEDDSPINQSNFHKQKNSYSRWYDDKIYVTKEEFEQCDFRYELNGVYTGFNQQQIMDAVRGVNDGILTLAASSLDFIQRLKMAYGDYITVLYLCSDPMQIRKDYEDESLSDKERQARIKADQTIRRVYLENIRIFDGLIPYSGEDSVFNEQAVYRMFSVMIERRRTIEKQLNDKNYVELPYLGRDPYIFISYARMDKEQVYPILAFLQTSGYRVWYDDGIPGGANWKKIIAMKIAECSDFILFSSAQARESSHISAEINAADLCNEERDPQNRMRIITIRLDHTKMNLEDEMYLSRQNMLSVKDTQFQKKLLDSLGSRTREQ